MTCVRVAASETDRLAFINDFAADQGNGVETEEYRSGACSWFRSGWHFVTEQVNDNGRENQQIQMRPVMLMLWVQFICPITLTFYVDA